MVVTVTYRVISPGMFIGVEDADVVSFGSGQPDLAPPFDVGEVFLNFSRFKYGKVGGEDELKAKLRGYVKREFGHCVDEDCIMVTNGLLRHWILCLGRCLSGQVEGGCC